MEIHGYPGIFINFQKILDITNPDFPDIHRNPCMPKLPYMDIQHGTPRKVGHDINI